MDRIGNPGNLQLGFLEGRLSFSRLSRSLEFIVVLLWDLKTGIVAGSDYVTRDE